MKTEFRPGDCCLSRSPFNSLDIKGTRNCTLFHHPVMVLDWTIFYEISDNFFKKKKNQDIK